MGPEKSGHHTRSVHVESGPMCGMYVVCSSYMSVISASKGSSMVAGCMQSLVCPSGKITSVLFPPPSPSSHAAMPSALAPLFFYHVLSFFMGGRWENEWISTMNAFNCFSF